MNAAEFANFWRIQGHRVIETRSCYWYNSRPFCFISLPFHRAVSPSYGELARVMVGGPSVAIRFLGPAAGEGGLFICSDRNYGLSSLEKKARNQTRRGLENCKIERLDFPYLSEHGSPLNEDSCRRQGRERRMFMGEPWRRYCDAASRTPDFEAWGAFVDGRLGAFMVAALVEDHFSIIHQSSATNLLQHYPNNALTFAVAKLKLACPQVARVSYGLKSPDHRARSNERFKMNMGFEFKPFKECVVLNPLLKPFLSSPGGKTVHWMARNHPGSDFWRRASGILQGHGA